MEVKAHMDPYFTLISGWLIVLLVYMTQYCKRLSSSYLIFHLCVSAEASASFSRPVCTT
jgi:hypothetical protein